MSAQRSGGNSTGIGLYHPSAASLPPFGDDGDWSLIGNYVHDNNEPNTAPPGSMSADLPPGGGILVLGVDRVNIQKNRIENNGPRVTGKRQCTTGHFVEDNAKGKQIRTRVHILPACLLRRHVSDCAERDIGLRQRFGQHHIGLDIHAGYV